MRTRENPVCVRVLASAHAFRARVRVPVDADGNYRHGQTATFDLPSSPFPAERTTLTEI